MKISPLSQGSGVPAQANIGQATSSTLVRAKALAAGITAEEPQSSGDPQADRARQSIRKIKMRTQVSPDRPFSQEEEIVEPQGPEVVASESAEIPISDTNEPAEVVEATKPLSPQFAALAKQKRALQVKERELAQREEALKNQNPSDDFISKAELAANPLKIFESGITYDQLTDAILNNPNGSNAEINEIRKELKSLKEGFDTQLSSRDQAAEQQVLTQIERDVQALVNEGDDFEAIRETKTHKKVVDLIHKTWKTTGEVLSEREAAELIETQLIEDAMPFTKLKKVQSRLTPAQEQVLETPPQAQNGNVKVMRTLTNRDGTTKVYSSRRERALAAFSGIKKG